MPVTLNASTSSGFIATSDTSGNLALQANGSTKMTIGSSITMNSGGLITSGTAQASTSGTNIDFTGIPSWVKRVTVMFSGVSTNGNSIVQVQLGAGSFLTSGYLSAASNISTVVTSANQTAGFQIGLFNSTANVRHGNIVLNNISGNTWTCFGVVSLSDAAATGTTAGSVTLSGTLDRVRITTVNGTDTFDAGTINILYEG